MWKIISVFILMSMLSGCISTQSEPSTSVTDPLAAAKNRLALGLTYLKSKNYQSAKLNIDKALDFAPRYADAHYGLAYYYQQVGEDNLAEESYLIAFNLDNDNAEIANSYGAFLCAQKRYEEAEVYFKQAIDDQRYLATAQSYENLAICSQSQGDIPAAIGYLNKALNFEPSRQQSLYLLAELYASQNQHEKAQATINSYERVVGPRPDSVFLSFDISLSQGNVEKARDWLNVLLSRYPQHPNTSLAQQQLEVYEVQSAKQATLSSQSTVLDSDPKNNLPSQNNNATPLIHRLAQGETLYRLSRLYNVSVSDIMAWNNIAQTHRLSVGITLIVGYN